VHTVDTVHYLCTLYTLYTLCTLKGPVWARVPCEHKRGFHVSTNNTMFRGRRGQFAQLCWDVLRLFGEKCAHKVCIDNKYVNMCTLFCSVHILHTKCTLCTPCAHCAHCTLDVQRLSSCAEQSFRFSFIAALYILTALHYAAERHWKHFWSETWRPFGGVHSVHSVYVVCTSVHNGEIADDV
jgi:hypothetical protein